MDKINVDLKFMEDRYNDIKDHVIKTPVIYATKLSEMTGNQVYIKLENLQKTGSFKIRGALGKMLAIDKEQLKKGVVAGSAGNHSQGVSFAAKMLGVPATIFMPTSAPLSKVNATKALGAKVIMHGQFFDDANNRAIEYAKETGALYVSGGSDEYVYSSHASMAIETISDIGDDIDYMFVPIGSGGMSSGISTYMKLIGSKCKVIGVQTENVPSYYEARKSGKAFTVNGKLSIADGIAVKQTGEKTFTALQKYLDDVILVTEDEIAETILYLFENCKILAEGAGAVATAAILFNKLNLKGKKVVAFLSGGNIDVTTLLNITNRALINQNRRVVFSVDVPVGKEHRTKISNVMDEEGIIVHKMFDSQYESNLQINHEIIRLVVDINSKEQLKNAIKKLEGFNYTIVEKDQINKIIK